MSSVCGDSCLQVEDPIPLYDGEPSGARIIHGSKRGADATSQSPDSGSGVRTVHSKCQAERRACEHVRVCFSPNDPTGPAEHIECPLHNISAGGMSIEFDRAMAIGTAATVSYMTISHRPVHITCTVCHCGSLDSGRHRLGLRFARRIGVEKRRPAKLAPGRDVFPRLRPRKLRPIESAEG